MIMQAPPSAGFADPVLDSQAVFRVLLDAMARPARPQPLQGIEEPPSPLFATTAALALTLLDPDTKVWLDPRLAENSAVRAWLAFHCGAPPVNEPKQADFALIAEPAMILPFEDFAQGDDRYPDRSTTLVLQVEAFTDDGATLSGPGFAEPLSFGAAPLSEDFWTQVSANHSRFPCGVDLILASRDAVAGLPRSTRPSAGTEAA